MIIDTEDVAGARGLENGQVCSECITDDEWKNLELDHLIMKDEVDNSDKLYFCIRCRNQF